MTENKSFEEMRNEFVRELAKSGVFLTSDEVDVIFNIYSVKTSNILKMLDATDECNTIKTKERNEDETKIC